MKNLWFILLYQPLINALAGLYLLFNNLGLAIVGLTIIIRFLLLPLTLPSMRAAKKMQSLAPEIDKLKKKYANDKQKLAQAQMEFYRQKGINPASGCLPQIIQILILIALFQAFQQILGLNGTEALDKLNQALYPFVRLKTHELNLSFLYLKLTEPDLIKISGLPSLPGIFLLGSALAQFFTSKLMMPKAKSDEKIAKKTPGEADDFMTAFQTQSLYLMPLMTIFIGYRFPSGLTLYWFVFSILNLIQQIFIK